MAQRYVYTFYAELRDYKPKIWRRFEIDGDKTVADLAYAIMVMFEMQASHLFGFRENRYDRMIEDLSTRYPKEEILELIEEKNYTPQMFNRRFELVNEFTEDYLNAPPVTEANEVTINQAYTDDWEMTLDYDYGDSWEVALTFESREKREVLLKDLPNILDGSGYGIIEDVGGIPGLADLAKALKKGSGKKYEEYCEWLGGAIPNLDTFDIDEANYRIKKLLRVYKDIYEHRIEPSDNMIRLILREDKK